MRYALDPDGKIGEASVWFDSVAPTPFRATLKNALLGKECGDEAIAAAAEHALTQAKPLPDAAYKVKLAKVALKRALEQARGRS